MLKIEADQNDCFNDKMTKIIKMTKINNKIINYMSNYNFL